MDTWMKDQLSMFDLMNCASLPNATSSQELVDGHTPCALPDGQTTDQCGQVPAHASLSAQQETGKEKATKDTYGQSGLTLSASAALQQSLENRLRVLLPMGGLTMFIKDWKPKVTPAGRQYCQLAVSARPISETDCGLWLTPRAHEVVEPAGQAAKRLGDRRPETACSLGEQAMNAAMWPTPNANKHTKNSADPQKMKENGSQTCLADAAWIASKAMWVSPTAQDHSRGNKPPRPWDNGIPLSQQVAMWPTPKAGAGTVRPVEKSTHLQTIAQASMGRHHLGKMESGSTAQTGNKGSLNPAFPCWLMGYPTEWESCADMVTRSCPRQPRNSSKP